MEFKNTNVVNIGSQRKRGGSESVRFGKSGKPRKAFIVLFNN